MDSWWTSHFTVHSYVCDFYGVFRYIMCFLSSRYELAQNNFSPLTFKIVAIQSKLYAINCQQICFFYCNLFLFVNICFNVLIVLMKHCTKKSENAQLASAYPRSSFPQLPRSVRWAGRARPSDRDPERVWEGRRGGCGLDHGHRLSTGVGDHRSTRVDHGI